MTFTSLQSLERPHHILPKLLSRKLNENLDESIAEYSQSSSHVVAVCPSEIILSKKKAIALTILQGEL
jgi:hypothetical protein